jgi:hypothetical protein
VQLMRANFDRLVDGAEDAARGLGGAAAPGSLTVAISCVGRRLILRERAARRRGFGQESHEQGYRMAAIGGHHRGCRGDRSAA